MGLAGVVGIGGGIWISLTDDEKAKDKC